MQLPINWINLLRSPGGDGYGPELYTLSNAAADPNGTEADAMTGLTAVNLAGTGDNVSESQGAVKSDGDYAVYLDSNDTPTAAARIYVDLQAAPFNIVNDDEVRLIFKWRHVGSGGTWRMGGGATSGGTSVVLDVMTNTEITFVEEIFKYTHTSSYRFLIFQEGSGTNDGGIYIDNISIRVKL